MLFFFGTKTAGLSSAPAEISCESCNQTQHRVYVFQRYFHIFWIPVIPIGKLSIIECQHCKQATPEKEMSERQKSISLPKRRAAKTPVYTFAGTVLIACLIGWGEHYAGQEKEMTQTFIVSPAANDITVIQITKDHFQIVKLLSVEDNKISFQVGNYGYKTEYSAMREIRKKRIEENDYFSDKILKTSKEQYQALPIKFVQRENEEKEL